MASQSPTTPRRTGHVRSAPAEPAVAAARASSPVMMGWMGGLQLLQLVEESGRLKAILEEQQPLPGDRG